MLYVNGMNWVRSICVQVLLLFFSSKLPVALPASWSTGLQICAHWHLHNTTHKAAAYWESVHSMAGSHFFCSKNIVRFIFNFIRGKHIFIHMGSMFKIIKAWATRRGVWSRAVYHGLHVYSSLYSLWLWWIAVIWYGFCLSLMSVLASLDISCPFVVPHQDLFKERWAGGWIRSAPEVLPHLIHPISPPWPMLCSADWGCVCCLSPGCLSCSDVLENLFLFRKLCHLSSFKAVISWGRNYIFLYNASLSLSFCSTVYTSDLAFRAGLQKHHQVQI